jgi:hypothetical protein
MYGDPAGQGVHELVIGGIFRYRHDQIRERGHGLHGCNGPLDQRPIANLGQDLAR